MKIKLYSFRLTTEDTSEGRSHKGVETLSMKRDKVKMKIAVGTMRCSSKRSTYSIMEQSIGVSGRENKGTGTEFKFGRTEQSMRGIGEIIKRMERVNSGMQMEMSTMEIGRKIKLMVEGCTCM